MGGGLLGVIDLSVWLLGVYINSFKTINKILTSKYEKDTLDRIRLIN